MNEITDNDPRGECSRSPASPFYLSSGLNEGILPLFITSIGFDFVIFILTLRKGLQARARGARSTLLQAVVHGGNIYFMYVSTLSVEHSSSQVGIPEPSSWSI